MLRRPVWVEAALVPNWTTINQIRESNMRDAIHNSIFPTHGLKASGASSTAV
jgi:hypothetical protein